MSKTSNNIVLNTVITWKLVIVHLIQCTSGAADTSVDNNVEFFHVTKAWGCLALVEFWDGCTGCVTFPEKHLSQNFFQMYSGWQGCVEGIWSRELGIWKSKGREWKAEHRESFWKTAVEDRKEVEKNGYLSRETVFFHLLEAERSVEMHVEKLIGQERRLWTVLVSFNMQEVMPGWVREAM